MSLILDALRKSEAERRRAQAPDLFAEPQLALPRLPRAWPAWTWPLLGIGGLIAVMLVLRALWPTPPATAAHVAADRPYAMATPTSPPSDPLVDPTGAPAAAQATVVRASQPPAQVHAPASAPPATPSDPFPTPATRADTRPPAPPPRTPETSTTTAPEAPPQLPPPPLPASPQADGGTVRLADLGTEERAQLPPLKLSMHMWNDAPAQRFVILDGQRLGEGDRIGDAVVEQITREGAILAWNGRRLAVSMR